MILLPLYYIKFITLINYVDFFATGREAVFSLDHPCNPGLCPDGELCSGLYSVLYLLTGSQSGLWKLQVSGSIGIPAGNHFQTEHPQSW